MAGTKKGDAVAGGTKDDWALLIRRAYRVPDIVGDAAASSHISLMLGKVVSEDQPACDPDVVPHFLQSVVDAGAAGELDGYLVEVGDGHPADVLGVLAERSGCDLKVARLMLENVMDRIANFFKQHPAARYGGV